jgi:diaminopimelate epimerase
MARREEDHDVRLPRRPFWKMTGSGNDFVFFDARTEPAGVFESPEAVAAVCDRRLGVGADGVVFIERGDDLPFSIRYLNRDGSLAELCGNASLCSVSLACELGIAERGRPFRFGTTSGPLVGRVVAGQPEFDAPSVADATPAFQEPLEEGEERIGYAKVGVPHLVVLCANAAQMNVVERGRRLRHHRALPAGANANFVSRSPSGWTMRTYERGVEEETLACGTGAVATAALLRDWGLADEPVTIETRSGAPLVVRFGSDGSRTVPSLRGEGRLVFTGSLIDVPVAE